MKKVIAHIERGKDGLYSVYMNDDSLDYNINGQGKTADDAVNDFNSVYNAIKEFYAQKGKLFTEVEFEFVYEVSATLASCAEIFSLVGLSRITGINKSQLSRYLNGTSMPSLRTTERIKNGMRNYAAQLTQMAMV